MHIKTSTKTSSLDILVGASFAALSMFIVGYSITRAYLSPPASTDAPVEYEYNVVPHQGTLWNEFGS